MKIIRFSLNLVLVCGVVFLIILQNKAQQSGKEISQLSGTANIITKEILEFFPQAVSLSPVDNVWTKVYNEDEEKLGYIIYTAPYSNNIQGFAGNTPLMIALDKKQKIIGTKILNNNESPSYLNHVNNKGLFNSWNGLSLQEALNKQVDAISGATYTSEAVINSLKIRLSVLNNTDYLQNKNIWNIVKRICSLLVILFAVFCFFYPKKTKPYRLYLLGLSVIVLGFWQGTLLSIATIHAALVNGVSFFTHCIFLIIITLSILLPFVTGKQFYCAYLCSFGALQELTGKLTKKKLNIPASINKTLIFIRKIILLCIIFLLIIGVTFDLSLIEPFPVFNFQSASTFTLIFAGLFLVLSAFITKPWCRFFCPTGQLLDTFKDISLQKNKK
jgi:Na+-translocating ferredoxin:NAD+ oxidoreductase RnfG subunit